MLWDWDPVSPTQSSQILMGTSSFNFDSCKQNLQVPIMQKRMELTNDSEKGIQVKRDQRLSWHTCFILPCQREHPFEGGALLPSHYREMFQNLL